MNLTSWYSAVLHVAGLAALVVLVALGKVSWAEGGPLIAGLLGLGVGVSVTPTQVVQATPVVVSAIAPRPAMPTSAT